MSSSLIDMHSTYLRNKLISNTVKHSNDFYNIPILNIFVIEKEHESKRNIIYCMKTASKPVNCVYTFKFIRLIDDSELPCLEYGSFHNGTLIVKHLVYFRIYEVHDDYFLYEFTGKFLHEPYYKRLSHNHIFNEMFWRTAERTA